jgi:oligopeptide transport system permease protein
MAKYISYRILWFFIVLFLIISIVYFSTSMTMWKFWPSQSTFVEFLAVVFSRYLQFWRNVIFSWDWGKASSGQDAWELLVFRMPRTLRIVLATFAISLFIGILLGVISAFTRKGLFDQVITFFTLVFGSIPNYILIFFFMMFFGYYLKWFPPIPPPESDGLWRTLQGAIIPVMALSLMPIAKITSMMRGEFKEIFESDYTLLLKTKGMTEHQMILRHHLKNAIIPVLPEISNTFIIVLSSSFILERINNTAGVAALLFNSLFSPIMGAYYISVDINTTVLVCAFYSGLSMLLVLTADIVLAFLDPRVKMGAKKRND